MATCSAVCFDEAEFERRLFVSGYRYRDCLRGYASLYACMENGLCLGTNIAINEHHNPLLRPYFTGNKGERFRAFKVQCKNNSYCIIHRPA